MAIRNEPNQDGGGRHLEFVRTGNSAIRSAVPENPALEQNMKWIGRPVAEIYGHLNFFQDGGGRHLGFVRTVNSAIRSADPENPTYRTKHEVNRITRCRDVAIRVSWEHMEPPFWGKGRS